MSRLWMDACGLVVLLASPGSAQVTQRVSVASAGTQGNSFSVNPSISADARHVAFRSSATNLVVGDTNGRDDVFVHDRYSGTTERVSVSTSEVQGNSNSDNPSISADGRYVAFVSDATNLVVGDSNGHTDVFLRDRQSGTTERVSVANGGAEGNSGSYYPSISADGRYVAFMSYATNLVAGDANGYTDVFVRDRQSGTTERVSVSTGGVEENADGGTPSISADGRYVAFGTTASNLVTSDTNGRCDVFVRDRPGGTTELVSVANGGTQGNGDSSFTLSPPSISSDGRYVAFESAATNLVPGDTNGAFDVFVRDRQGSATERVSVDSGGVQGNDLSSGPSISSDGRYVSFNSYATNLVAGDTNTAGDVFVHDRFSGATERASVSSGGAEGNSYSGSPSISADGRYLAFWSAATNLVAGDTNGNNDVFVRDRASSGFTSSCDSGTGGVIACPCSNPPSGPGRGCNNSSATGGAILSASGVAYLSQDTLVFTTSAERPTATSIVGQWTGASASGVVFGMGVRCTSGTLKRLYTKTASGGSIIAPEFGAGDPTVSARSAALGDTILAGQSRWYFVYYRDPVVLGGCQPTATFNATQTGRVDWSM